MAPQIGLEPMTPTFVEWCSDPAELLRSVTRRFGLKEKLAF